MTESVVVTGYGALTGHGTGLADAWQAVVAGKTAIRPMAQWGLDEWPYALASELPDYQPRQLIADRKLLKFICRYDVLGLNAAQQALDHSGLLAYRDGLEDTSAFNDRSGIYVGSPGNKFIQQYDFMPLLTHAEGHDMSRFAKGLFDHVHPMWLLRILPNNVLAYAGTQYQFKGANANITNHVTGGLQAIIEAYHAIKNGLVDRALVIAYDSPMEPHAIYYFSHLGLLSSTAVKSFDEHHDGTVFGEGAGALLLEKESLALARKATIYADILSGANCSEAQGVFAVDKQSPSLIRAANSALQQATLNPSDVGMVTAHANGNKASDITDSQAINTVFGNTVPVTGFKWSIGHTMVASGMLDTLLTIQALQENTVPGIATLKKLSLDCQGLSVNASPKRPRSTVGMVMNRGFAGQNACLLLSTRAQNHDR